MRREGLSAREYTQSLLGPLLAASASSTPMAARSERYSAGDAARALATSALVRMSATWSRLPVSSEVLLTTTCAWGMRPSLSSW